MDRQADTAEIAHRYSQISGACRARQGVLRFQKSCYFAPEGAITVCVIQAIEKLSTGFVQSTRSANRRTLAAFSGAAPYASSAW